MLAGIAILLAADVSVMQPQTPLPSDFRLHFEFGDCWSDVVDTDNDHYVRVLYSGKTSTRTVPLRLSDAHRRQLLEWIDESRFFELPAYVSATGEDGLAMIPSPRYELTVQRSGVQRVVTFYDSGNSTSGEVIRVKTLVQRLVRFFTELPQVKRLPQTLAACR